jgi:predicted 3-demethylubiquinone-9 3-methyltransferase (glyoxalase superfamily)
MSKLTTWLWYDTQAEEAMDLYCSIFKNSKKGPTSRYPAEMGGGVMTAECEIEGYKIFGLNGGPQFKHTEAFSIMVDCKDQAEVDHYWNALVADGGEESMCGWLKDKFGVSWQIIPSRLMELQADPDKARAGRAMQAMLKMKKIVIADLEAAANAK